MYLVELVELAGPEPALAKSGKEIFIASLWINLSLFRSEEQIVHYTKRVGKRLSNCIAPRSGWGINPSGVWKLG